MLKRILQFILKLAAQAVLSRHEPKVIGITGSVGKTIAKEAVFAVLSTNFRAARSRGNFNNELGLPLAVLGVSASASGVRLWISAGVSFFRVLLQADYPEILVLEMAADHPGDIRYLVDIARPQIGVVTRVGEAHTEFFGSLEAVQKEKSQLVSGLPNSGIAVLNADDPRVAAMRGLHGGAIITFGLSESADVRAESILVAQRTFGSDIDPEKDIATKFSLRYSGRVHDIELPGLLGTPAVYALLSAFAVGAGLGIKPEKIVQAFKDVLPEPGRLRPLAGIKRTILLDDTYNSSPEAAVEALKVLRQLRARRRLAVLGDMLELGAQTESAHRKLGRLLRAGSVDMLFTVGERAKFIADEARASGFPKTKIFEFEDARNAGKKLQDKLLEGDAVLIKGSQALRMERITQEIMAEPLRAGELLCRQDPRWQKSV